MPSGNIIYMLVNSLTYINSPAFDASQQMHLNVAAFVFDVNAENKEYSMSNYECGDRWKIKKHILAFYRLKIEVLVF